MVYPDNGVTVEPSVFAVGGTHDRAAVPLVVAGVTVMVALCAAEPPAPAQLSVYVVDALSAPVDCEPAVARLPDHPPDAVQAVALVEDQVNVELPPADTLVGLALSATLGSSAATVTVVD
jgi:hypothetical protein